MNILSRNNIHISGQGRQALLFAHGFGCDQHMWRLVAPAFQDKYKIILFDHVGAGQSDATAYSRNKYDSLQGYATDILDICQELRLEKTVFVGHSVSTMIGILAAIRQPEQFEKLILVSPSPCYLNKEFYQGGFSEEEIMGLLQQLESNYLGWSSQMATLIMSDSTQAEVTTELANSFCRADPAIVQHFARVTFLSDNRIDLPLNRVPSLIIQCAHDRIAPVHVGDYLHQHLKNSSMVTLPVTGHCPHLSDPKETIDAMRHFLENA